MKKRFPLLTLLILSCFVMSGCPGLADYSIDLSGNYSLLRTSGHNITIAPKNEHTEGIWDAPVIPAEVVAVGWNAAYIIAKQQDYPQEVFYYWILHVNDGSVEGPLTLSDFRQKLQAYGITDLEMQPVGELER